jgi:hypothetical protein
MLADCHDQDAYRGYPVHCQRDDYQGQQDDFEEQCLKPVDLPGMGCTFPVTE